MSESDPPDQRGGDAAARSTDQFEQVADPGADRRSARQHQEIRPRQWDLVVMCSAGGILGAWARYAVGLLIPHRSGQFPWSTAIVNVTGSALLGALMVVLLELTSPHRLVRPFLGVGVLGGYTTFSTFAVDVERLVLDHRLVAAMTYTMLTVVACGAAVWLSTTLTLNAGRAVIATRIRRRHTVRSNR